MKTYCYMLDSNGIINLICSKLNDEGVTYYNNIICDIDLDNCKTEDIINIFKKDKYKKKIKIVAIKNLENIKVIICKATKKPTIDKDFLKQLLSDNKAECVAQAIALRKEIEYHNDCINDLKDVLSSTLNKQKSIDDYAKVNNIDLYKIEVECEEEF